MLLRGFFVAGAAMVLGAMLVVQVLGDRVLFWVLFRTDHSR